MADESAPGRARSGPGPALVIATSIVGMALAWLLFGQSVDRYASTAEVLVAELATAETSPDSERAIENEARFARSDRLQGVMAANLPGIPIDITIDTDPVADVVRFTAIDPSPRRAQRVAQTWAEFFVSERRQALIDGWLSTRDALERELVTLGQAIADARVTGDEALAETLQARRDRAVAIDASMLGEIGALRSSTGAAIVVPANLPVEPLRSTSGRTALIGLGLGALAGAVWLALGRLVGRDEAIVIERAGANDALPFEQTERSPAIDATAPHLPAHAPHEPAFAAAVERSAGSADGIDAVTPESAPATTSPPRDRIDRQPEQQPDRPAARPLAPVATRAIRSGGTRTTAAASPAKPRVVALPAARLSDGVDLPVADTPSEPAAERAHRLDDQPAAPAAEQRSGAFGRYIGASDAPDGAATNDDDRVRHDRAGSESDASRIVAFPLPTADVVERRPAASDD